MPLRAFLTFPILLQLFVAVLQGLMAWRLQAHDYYTGGPAIESWAVMPVLLLAGLSLWLLGPQLSRRDIWPRVLGLAVLCSVLSAWACQRERDTWDSLSPTFYIACITFVGLTGLAFIQARLQASPHRYEDLARAAWYMVAGLLLAAVMLGAYWILLALWAALFSALGYLRFEHLFYHPAFAWITSTLVLNLGLHLGLRQVSLLDAQRILLRQVCLWLLPMANLVTLLFLAALPLLGLQPLWNTGHASDILLGLILFNLLLVNGVFQEGQAGTAYPRLLDLWVRAGLFCLPVLALAALYGAWLRVEQHGLTPYRYVGSLLGLLALAHSVALAWAALRRGDIWLGRLRRSNPLLALVACALAIGLHTPWFNAEQVSAWQQYRQVLEGTRPAKYADIGYLKFKLGEAGRQYLARLENEYPQAPALNDAARAQLADRFVQVNKAEHYFQAMPLTPEDERNRASMSFEWIGTPVVDAEKLRDENLAYLCASGCLLAGLDLDGDGQAEILVVSKQAEYSGAEVYKLDEKGALVALGSLMGDIPTDELIDGLRNGGVTLQPQHYKEVRLGDKVLRPIFNR